MEDLSGVYKICVQGSHGDGLLVDELLAGVQIKSNQVLFFVVPDVLEVDHGVPGGLDHG